MASRDKMKQPDPAEETTPVGAPRGGDMSVALSRMLRASIAEPVKFEQLDPQEAQQAPTEDLSETAASAPAVPPDESCDEMLAETPDGTLEADHLVDQSSEIPFAVLIEEPHRTRRALAKPSAQRRRARLAAWVGDAPRSTRTTRRRWAPMAGAGLAVLLMVTLLSYSAKTFQQRLEPAKVPPNSTTSLQQVALTTSSVTLAKARPLSAGIGFNQWGPIAPASPQGEAR